MILRYKNDLIGAMPKVTASGTVTTVTQELDHLSVIKERDPKSPAYPDRPRAYLNFVLFDEDFNLVEGSSGVKQVAATPDELQTLAQDNVIMEKSGFLYVYTSNETQQDVFFDNVTVALAGTPVLEETHYYPFGLTISGLSEKALYNPENKRGYNGNELQNKEFTNGTGLELYDFNARSYDPQIGRFLQVDPLGEDGGQEGMSTYHFSFNNPVRYNDPDGKCPVCPAIPIVAPLVLEGLVELGLITVGNAGIASTILTLPPPEIPGSNDPNLAVQVHNIQRHIARKEQLADQARAAAAPKAPLEDQPIYNMIMNGGKLPVKPGANKNMHGGGKNAQHANQKARAAAKERYDDVKKEHDALNKKTNKTKEENKQLDKLKDRLKHEKRKMDNTGENHSRKGKGSN